jgi:excinuclease ABC subunit A
MNFLPDIYVPCEVCKGARFNRETLEVHYKGKNIAEVLDTTIEEAADFFEAIGPIHRHLKTLVEVGLGYVRLGQPAPTLSGGEAQRVKLASELQKRSTGRTVYVLDEPTTGLHFADVEKLLGVINGLVDKGNTVIVIEHNLDVIKTADHVIDMGPEGGSGGGLVIAEGTPEEIAAQRHSYTGQFLAPVLAGRASRSFRGDATAGSPASVAAMPAATARRAATNGNSRTNGAAKNGGRNGSAKLAPAANGSANTAPGKTIAAKTAPANTAPAKTAPPKSAPPKTAVDPAVAAAARARRKAAKLI